MEETAAGADQQQGGLATEEAQRGATPLERLASFRFTYLAIFFFLLAYVFTVEGLQRFLDVQFREAVEQATQVDPHEGLVTDQVQQRVGRLLAESAWIRWGQVRVRPVVVGSDGRTLLYAGGRLAPEVEGGSDAHLLPAIVDVDVAVSHNSLAANGILVSYAALLITVLSVYTRRLTRREAEKLDEVMSARDSIVARTRGIEDELGMVRERLAQLEPEHEIYAEEVETLGREREQLMEELATVEQREAALRSRSVQAKTLEEERRSLEELLEEAASDLEQKDDEIRSLQKQVKKAGKAEPRAKEGDLLARRLRTLYKNLEVDDQAVQSLVALRDEGLKLKAEEALKRLSDESETAAIRRKVGGLPPHLSIFELGYAGKGRIYYTKGRTRRYRLLLVGAKNSQKTDLEYLSRLPKE